jgi:asparagine synthase (glutamine-hydrolysing)
VCGICGIVARQGALDPALAAALPAMTEALRHRGPDTGGTHVDGRAALGHRRLSIIDRAGGDQPQTNEDGRVRVVFNGEIYNHVELRTQLEARGHVFRTVSDTEVIVHGWEEWAEEMPAKLIGMFALAIMDDRDDTLFLARDHLGKKPLFWAMLGGALHFASEIKALRESPAWDGTLDDEAMEFFVTLGYVPAPRSIHRQVRKLEPAHWLRLRDGHVEIRRFWDVTEFDTDRRPEADVLADLEELLGRCVADRLESEVPLGAFLSGGIDSGLVVSWMAEAMARPPTTVSVGFADRAHNELEAAARVAARWSTDHHPEQLDPRLDEVLDRIVHHLDEPFGDASAVPTYFVCGAARRHVTVCLSGDGGDETFGGYDFRYVPHAMECRARALVPGAPGRRLAAWLGRVWPRSPRLPRPLRLSTVWQNLSVPAETAYWQDLCFLKPPDATRLLGRGGDANGPGGLVWETVTAPYRNCPSSSPLQRAQYADLHVYLPNDPLVKVDRMSMAHSLEVRCPLLDRRVVEFAFRLPTTTKMPHLAPKHLLRELAKRRLPAENVNLPKRGFTAPVRSWITHDFRDRFTADVLDGASPLRDVLDTGLLRTWHDDLTAGRADRSWPLWAAWMLSRWMTEAETPAAGPVP